MSYEKPAKGEISPRDLEATLQAASAGDAREDVERLDSLLASPVLENQPLTWFWEFASRLASSDLRSDRQLAAFVLPVAAELAAKNGGLPPPPSTWARLLRDPDIEVGIMALETLESTSANQAVPREWLVDVIGLLRVPGSVQ